MPHETQPFVALGAMPMAVLRSAYMEAVRRRADSVSTLDVLAHLAVYEKPNPRSLLADSRAALVRLAAEPHRMPARPAAGELMPSPVLECDPEVRAVLREVEWQVRRMAGRPMMVKESDVQHWDARPRWTAGARAMVAGALTAARERGVPFAGRAHLLLGMLRLPDCDGTRYVFPYTQPRMAAMDWLSREPDLRRSDPPYPDFDFVTMVANQPSLFDRLMRWFIAPFFRLTRVGPLFGEIPPEAKRQAVRLGHDVIGPAHALLAMLTLDAALDAAGIRVPAELAGRNRGAATLRAHGIDADRLRELAVARGGPEEPPAEVLAKQLNRLRPGDPFEGAEIAAGLDRAREISLAYRHRDTGTSHLLLALVDDDAGEAAAILRALGVDPAAVRERVKQDLATAAVELSAPTVAARQHSAIRDEGMLHGRAAGETEPRRSKE